MKKTSSMRPPIIETAVNTFKQKVRTVNFNIEEKEDGSFEFDSIEIPPGFFDYDHIVSAIIRGRYSDDAMQAIINNHLIEDAAAEHEFVEMQAWRALAKTVAREAIAAAE